MKTQKGGKVQVTIAVGKPRSFEGSPKGLFARPGYGHSIAPDMPKESFRFSGEKIDEGWLVSHPVSCHSMFPERKHACRTLSDAVSYIESAFEKFGKGGEKAEESDYHESEEGEDASEE